MQKNNFQNRESFTLIELLVVLAIVAILSVVVILTLNPSELIKQARDSTRLSDLSTLNSALGLFNGDVNAGFMGTSTVVYVSIADTTTTCVNLGLPSLPTGYIYNCVTSTSTKNIDGTGWIPVNFKLISFGNPLSSLPVDPVNTTSSRNYYTYVSGGFWDISATLEATKNKLGGANDKVSTDGGTYPDLYETGSKLTLLPVDYGDSSLVGYWKFNEGLSATTALDYSGFGNDGTMHSSAQTVVTNVYTASGCHSGHSCGNLTSSASNSIDSFTKTFNLNGQSFSVAAWVNQQVLAENNYGFVVKGQGAWRGWHLGYRHFVVDDSDGPDNTLTYNSVPTGTWVFVVGVLDVPSRTMSFYLNGSFGTSISVPATTNLNDFDSAGGSGGLGFGARYGGWAPYSDVMLNEIRIYNRALSAAEISALYNATK